MSVSALEILIRNKLTLTNTIKLLTKLIKKNGKILLGKRKGSHGEGSWCFPGGHLEFEESFEECAKREVLEETNLNIENIKLKTVTNDVFKDENKHYVTIFVTAKYKNGELKLKEPDKCEVWEWFDLDDLPEPLFLPVENLLKQDIEI